MRKSAGWGNTRENKMRDAANTVDKCVLERKQLCGPGENDVTNKAEWKKNVNSDTDDPRLPDNSERRIHVL